MLFRSVMRMAQLGSDWAVKALGREGWEWPVGFDMDGGLSRHDPILIQAVEEVGLKESAGEMTKLQICELRGDRYRIEEYDGWEKVVEPEDIMWTVVR